MIPVGTLYLNVQTAASVATLLEMEIPASIDREFQNQ
jgi:hypothetical protein